MVLSFDRKGKVLTVFLSGELDHHSSESVRIKIDNRIDEFGAELLILDFGGVRFMDSSGIGVVIGRYKKISESGGNVAIINLKSEVRRVFELAGLFKIVKEFVTSEEAINELDKKCWEE